MIKLVLLTGFLGTGKTTLLQSILKEYSDKKIAIIVNDFGEVNIDATIVRKDGVPMAELNNGSIFCACIKDNFLKSLIEMSALDIEYVFIEASGLADPASMTTMLSAISKKLVKPYDYKGSICVVDSKSFLELFNLLPALKHQIIYSNSILINKADLVDENRIIEINKKITSINDQANITVTTFCQLDLKTEVDNLTPVLEQPKESTNTVETKPKTIVLNSNKVLSFDALDNFFKELCESTYRIKGFAKTDKGSFEISIVGDILNYTPCEIENDKTTIMVISKVGIKIISIFTALSNKYLDGTLNLN